MFHSTVSAVWHSAPVGSRHVGDFPRNPREIPFCGYFCLIKGEWEWLMRLELGAMLL